MPFAGDQHVIQAPARPPRLTSSRPSAPTTNLKADAPADT